MKKKKNLFERFSNWATAATGSSAAFIIATPAIVIWAVTGPLFNYSKTWQGYAAEENQQRKSQRFKKAS